MITLDATNLSGNKKHSIDIKPTVFPDKTSQVWKLPKEVFNYLFYTINWHFEDEREIFDVGSLAMLIRKYKPHAPIYLNVPYLPFARQDKEVDNEKTFNLRVFAKFINSLAFTGVKTNDVHNFSAAWKLINNLENDKLQSSRDRVIEKVNPNYILYPDKGASERYCFSNNYCIERNFLYCTKKREETTGEFLGFEVPNVDLKENDKILIIDDLCDAGGTFIGIAKALREKQPKLQISLCISHGIFSKGIRNLTENGIDRIFTLSIWSRK